MACPMGSSSDDATGGSWPQMLCIPLPMAMFGVVIAFMFGTTIGTMMGAKRGMMAASGGHGGGKMWRHRRMDHHHHGYGMPPCKCGEPKQEWMVAKGSAEEAEAE